MATTYYRPKIGADLTGANIPSDAPLKYAIEPEEDGRGNRYALTVIHGEDVVTSAAYPTRLQAEADINRVIKQFPNTTTA